MGFGSIWHWVVVALVIAVIFGPLYFADKSKRLERKPYILRMVGAMFAAAAFAIIGIEFFGDNGGLFIVPLSLLTNALIMVWSVHRANDMGNSYWKTLLLFVPIANLIWLVLLCVKPSVSPAVVMPSTAPSTA